MKVPKSFNAFVFALIIISVTIILLLIWGYKFYFGTKQLPLTGKEIVQRQLKDTGRKTSSVTTTNVYSGRNDSLKTDTSDEELTLKIAEFNRIKQDIEQILQKKTAIKDSAADMTITELQKKMAALENENSDLSEKNIQLNELIKKSGENGSIKNSKDISSKLKPQSASSLPLLVTHLRFAAFNDFQQTTIASSAKKMNGSFEINVKPQNTSEIIFIVIVKPNGKVLRNSGYESGTFFTSSGKKVYSALLRFDNKVDNHNRLQFSISSEQFQKGKYIMQIYHRGIIIGRLEKTLY